MFLKQNWQHNVSDFNLHLMLSQDKSWYAAVTQGGASELPAANHCWGGGERHQSRISIAFKKI